MKFKKLDNFCEMHHFMPGESTSFIPLSGVEGNYTKQGSLLIVTALYNDMADPQDTAQLDDILFDGYLIAEESDQLVFYISQEKFSDGSEMMIQIKSFSETDLFVSISGEPAEFDLNQEMPVGTPVRSIADKEIQSILADSQMPLDTRVMLLAVN